jgi:hypothetical protein
MQAYNITNCEPMRFWDMMARVCVGLGYEPPKVPPQYYLLVIACFLNLLPSSFLIICSLCDAVQPAVLSCVLPGRHCALDCMDAVSHRYNQHHILSIACRACWYTPLVLLGKGARSSFENMRPFTIYQFFFSLGRPSGIWATALLFRSVQGSRRPWSPIPTCAAQQSVLERCW